MYWSISRSLLFLLAPNAGGTTEANSASENCKTMAKFAAAMMQKLQGLTFEKFETRTKPDFKLRIGITCSNLNDK